MSSMLHLFYPLIPFEWFQMYLIMWVDGRTLQCCLLAQANYEACVMWKHVELTKIVKRTKIVQDGSWLYFDLFGQIDLKKRQVKQDIASLCWSCVGYIVVWIFKYQNEESIVGVKPYKSKKFIVYRLLQTIFYGKHYDIIVSTINMQEAIHVKMWSDCELTWVPCFGFGKNKMHMRRLSYG